VLSAALPDLDDLRFAAMSHVIEGAEGAASLQFVMNRVEEM
jgi:hypothetical protein